MHRFANKPDSLFHIANFHRLQFTLDTTEKSLTEQKLFFAFWYIRQLDTENTEWMNATASNKSDSKQIWDKTKRKRMNVICVWHSGENRKTLQYVSFYLSEKISSFALLLYIQCLAAKCLTGKNCLLTPCGNRLWTRDFVKFGGFSKHMCNAIRHHSEALFMPCTIIVLFVLFIRSHWHYVVSLSFLCKRISFCHGKKEYRLL